MSQSLKQKTAVLDNAAEILDELVQEVDALLPVENKNITDRLGGTVAELKAIVECLRQKGQLDEEIVEVLDAA